MPTEQFPFIIKIKAKELSRSELALGTPEADQATANHSWHERGSRQTLSVRPPAPPAPALLPQKWHLENSRFVLPCSIHTSTSAVDTDSPKHLQVPLTKPANMFVSRGSQRGIERPSSEQASAALKAVAKRRAPLSRGGRSPPMLALHRPLTHRLFGTE